MVGKVESSFEVKQTVTRDTSFERASQSQSYDPDKLEDELELFPPKHNTATHRRLKPRHIQLIGVGGSIGTALFVQMGGLLYKGGAGSMFVAFTFWALVIICVTNSTAEMVTRFPINSPFVRLAGRCVDPAFEVMSGWNFFILEATLVPFEITAVTMILYYWAPGFNPAISVVPQLVLYFLINLCVPVNWYGELEFWLALFKVLLIVGLLLFTFITMVGGNPTGHAFGFSNFDDPAPFLEFLSTGNVGRFCGFAACMSGAAYYVVGPDYVSITAGEAIAPRKTLPIAFRGVCIRLTLFFSLGALAMGIMCSARDPLLVQAYQDGGGPGANASPYVVAMIRLGIHGLPSVVNAAVLSAAFSAGNSYFYCASRTLYGLAVEGHAPSCFKWCTKNGVPYMSALLVCAFALLALMQLGADSYTVLNWIVALGTVSQLVNYALMQVTYLKFYYACKAQGVDRKKFSYCGPFQPYCAYIALFWTSTMVFLAGWQVFHKGNWDTLTFIFNYIMIPINVVIFVFWKLWKKTKWRTSEEIDLIGGNEEVDKHEESVPYKPPKNWVEKLWRTAIGDI